MSTQNVNVARFARSSTTIKNAKKGSFWRVFENLKLAVKQCYQTGQFYNDKNWWKMPKFKCDILSDFQTMCLWFKTHFQSFFVLFRVQERNGSKSTTLPDWFVALVVWFTHFLVHQNYNLGQNWRKQRKKMIDKIFFYSYVTTSSQ